MASGPVEVAELVEIADPSEPFLERGAALGDLAGFGDAGVGEAAHLPEAGKR